MSEEQITEVSATSIISETSSIATATTEMVVPTDLVSTEEAIVEEGETQAQGLAVEQVEDEAQMGEKAPENGTSSSPRFRQIVEYDIAPEDIAAAIEDSIVVVEEGSIVVGYVVRIDKDEILLDIGYKSEGFIPAKELSIRNDVNPGEVVELNEEVEALVLEKEDKDGRLKLSKKRAQYERAWGKIEKLKEESGVVSGPVIEVVKGGLILDVGLRGFLPASLVDLRRVRDLDPYVGQELECKIIELDKNRNNVVLSRRAYLEETQAEQRQAFLNHLEPGEVRRGVVSSVVNFGAFVDLGGMDGLVHVSELSWKHVDHPSAVVKVGDEVDVQVLDVDLERERISLSLKACQEDPWEAFARERAVNDIVLGKVTKLVPFGAFVSVADGIEGLVHISEMSESHVDRPEEIVHVGEEVDVKIIDVDLARRRISLSIKQAGGTTSGGFDPDVYKDKQDTPFRGEERKERKERTPYGPSGFKIGDETGSALGDLKKKLVREEEKQVPSEGEAAPAAHEASVETEAPATHEALDAPATHEALDAPVEAEALDAPVEAEALEAPVEAEALEAPVEAEASEAPAAEENE